MIHNKKQISESLILNIDSFLNTLEDTPNFTATPNGKWSAGQHLDHLIRSTAPVLMALRLPRFVLSLFIGKTNRPSKNYAELVHKYKDKLEAGGAASGRFVPPTIKEDEKQLKVQVLQKLGQKLNVVINQWNEVDLDNYILPHPLLGKVTLREMLFFTIYHFEHHQQILKQRLIDSE